ncbi:hypothetical protein [uncultured Alistipes sp.]|nr:hypothetical protein [uncultured Alistipes sp.]
MIQHKFDYRWNLADAHFTKDKGKVFSCFACGGQFDGLQTCRV